jgi:hypothetical protein
MKEGCPDVTVYRFFTSCMDRFPGMGTAVTVSAVRAVFAGARAAASVRCTAFSVPPVPCPSAFYSSSS